MTRLKLKIQSKKGKMYIFGLLCTFLFLFMLGIDSSYAYYHKEGSANNIITAFVGDFEKIDSALDINIVIYKLNGYNRYEKTNEVPTNGTQLSKTVCTSPENETLNCQQNGSGDCNYTYNSSDHTITLNSVKRVTCKFYFGAQTSGDEEADDESVIMNGQPNQFEEPSFEGEITPDNTITPSAPTIDEELNNDTNTNTENNEPTTEVTEPSQNVENPQEPQNNPEPDVTAPTPSGNNEDTPVENQITIPAQEDQTVES